MCRNAAYVGSLSLRKGRWDKGFWTVTHSEIFSTLYKLHMPMHLFIMDGISVSPLVNSNFQILFSWRLTEVIIPWPCIVPGEWVTKVVVKSCLMWMTFISLENFFNASRWRHNGENCKPGQEHSPNKNRLQPFIIRCITLQETKTQKKVLKRDGTTACYDER